MGMQRFLVQIIAEKFNTPKAVHVKSTVVCFYVLKHFCVANAVPRHSNLPHFLMWEEKKCNPFNMNPRKAKDFQTTEGELNL